LQVFRNCCLDYASAQIDTSEDRDLKQQLLGADVRFSFH
jgi:hypothetical protein